MIKINRLFTFFLLLILMASPFKVSFAQDCSIKQELIFRFRPAEIGSYNVWDTVGGEYTADETFRAGVVVGADIIVAGEKRLVDQVADQADLILSRIDRRGRVTWSKSHKIDGLKTVFAIMRTSNGFMVAADRFKGANQSVIWFGFFNDKGRLKGQKELKDPKGRSMQGRYLTQAFDKKGYILSAQVMSDKTHPDHAVLYQLNAQAEMLQRSAYSSGTQNDIRMIRAGDDGYYLASGFETARDGRQVGWVLRLDRNLRLNWQRQYPRGDGAALYTVAQAGYNHILVGGLADPLDVLGSYHAGWLMRLDETNGNLIWQRYYAGRKDYKILGLEVHEADMISIAMNGYHEDYSVDQSDDFVRLLSLNRRGEIVKSDEYFNGKNAQMSDMILGPRDSRIMIGYSDVPYTIEALDDQEEQVKRSLDGWVVAGERFGYYQDPCEP